MTLLLGIPLSFIAAAVPALLYTWLVWWCDRYEREPRSLLILTFMWGAAPAVALSLIAEMVFNLPLALLSSRAAQNIVAAGAIAPIVEETVKGAILLALFLLAYQEFDGVLDGIEPLLSGLRSAPRRFSGIPLRGRITGAHPGVFRYGRRNLCETL